MKKKKLQYQLLITVFSVIIIATLISVADVYADPTSLPPTGPADILLHEGSAAQTKTGPLTINDNLHGETINATQINADSLCMNGDCRNSWPAPDLTVQNLDTVMLHSGTISSGYLNFNNVGVYVNGVRRDSFPKPTFVSWVFYNSAANGYMCGMGWTWCPNPVNLRDGAIIGFGRDLWGNLAIADFATLVIGTN